jgi:repressor LexA
MSRELTFKQREVLKFIYDAIKFQQLPPTVREIGLKFGFASTGTVRDHLKALVRKGYIKIAANKSRAIELVREKLFAIPILGKVQAGLPTLAVEEIEGYLHLDTLVFSDESTFALRVRGDSMINAGIMPDDLVLVKKQNMAGVGETIVALIGEEATVKKLQRDGETYFLQAANPNYSPIPVDQSVSIIGKVISVIRKFN